MNKNRNQFGEKSHKEAVKHLMVIISAAMCDTQSADVGDESSHYALQSIPHCLISARFFLSFEHAADLPTCCRKGHVARGCDLTVLPCWSVRPERATPTLSDRPCEHMHENWYVHKGPQNGRKACTHGLGQSSWNRFILWAINSSIAKLQVLMCVAHE